MDIPFSGLTPAQNERLDILIEEAAEVIQAATKVKRHGWESHNPKIPQLGTNRMQLEKELGHLYAAVERLVDAHELDIECIGEEREYKNKTCGQYLHHQEGS